jgi:hypothetical protein
MFGRNKGATPSQMRAMQQQQMAMDAMRAKSATKEGQARAAAADAEKAAMLAKTGVSSRPANPPMEQVEINKAKQLADANANAPRVNAEAIRQGGTGLSGLPPKAPTEQMRAAIVAGKSGPNSQQNTIPNTLSQANQSMSPMGGDGGAGGFKKGGKIKSKPAAKYSSGGSTSKASSRGDGIAQRGKTKGRMI